MDRRFIFFLVFCFTLGSTILVATVSIMTGQSWLNTVLYSLATMWIIGIASQVMMQHIYLKIVRPLREEMEHRKVEEAASVKLDLEDIEEISQGTQKYSEVRTAAEKPIQEALVEEAIAEGSTLQENHDAVSKK